MSDYGIVTEPGTVRFERLLPGSVERVWSWLTDSEKRGRWLATGPMELHPGGRVELRFANETLAGEAEPVPDEYRDCRAGVTNVGHVTSCEPHRLLAFTWGEGTGEPSEVTLELEPRGQETLLILTHRRLPTTEQMVSVGAGWHTHLGILGDRLRGAPPQPFWAVHQRLAQDYRDRLAAAPAG